MLDRCVLTFAQHSLFVCFYFRYGLTCWICLKFEHFEYQGRHVQQSVQQAKHQTRTFCFLLAWQKKIFFVFVYALLVWFSCVEKECRTYFFMQCLCDVDLNKNLQVGLLNHIVSNIQNVLTTIVIISNFAVLIGGGYSAVINIRICGYLPSVLENLSMNICDVPDH